MNRKARLLLTFPIIKGIAVTKAHWGKIFFEEKRNKIYSPSTLMKQMGVIRILLFSLIFFYTGAIRCVIYTHILYPAFLKLMSWAFSVSSAWSSYPLEFMPG